MTQVWGHRGASAYAPENTLPAFQLAVEQGADGVEFDVQLSADGRIVVIHDETVDRTTNGHGAVADLTLAELQSLDASAGKADYSGARIPTLAEVLDLLTPTRLRINIELKNSIVRYPGMEHKVLDHLRAFDLKKRVVISSFNHYSLQVVRSMKPGCTVGALYSDPLVRPWRYAKDLGVDAIHPPFPAIVDRRFVRDSHKAGLKVRAWMVEGEDAFRRAFHWELDAIMTNTPDLALAVRSRR